MSRTIALVLGVRGTLSEAEKVDPDNPEREWEEKLRDLGALRKEYAARAQKPPMRITEEDRARLRELARDLPRLWRAKTTKQEAREKVVRMLIEDVWFDKERNSRMKLLRQMFLLMQAAEEKSAEQLADRQAPVGRNSGRRAQGDVGLGHESFEA